MEFYKKTAILLQKIMLFSFFLCSLSCEKNEVGSRCPYFDPIYYQVPPYLKAFFPADSLGERDSTFFQTENGLRDTVIYNNIEISDKDKLISTARWGGYDNQCNENYFTGGKCDNSIYNVGYFFYVSYPEYKSGSPYNNSKRIEISLNYYRRKDLTFPSSPEKIILNEFKGKLTTVFSTEKLQFIRNFKLGTHQYAELIQLTLFSDTVWFAPHVGIAGYTLNGKRYSRQT